MNQTSYQTVTAMLNAFPQNAATNKEALLLTLEKATGAITDPAICRAASRFIAGDVSDQSKTFAPSVPEFVAEARRCQELLDIKAKPRLPPPGYFPGPLAPFQIRQQQRLAENSHLPVLFENVDNAQWRKLSAGKQIPAGAKWVATLGIVYGPQDDPNPEGAR